MKRKLIGKLGELISKQFLISQNYIFLDSNYKWKGGEIDLIFKKESEIVFVEVKARTNLASIYENETLRFKQIQRIKKTAYLYSQNHEIDKYAWRIDLVTVKFDLDNIKNEIYHFKNITNA